MESRKLYTLIFVLRDHQVLLGMKKRGLGKGFWNGFGGKLEAGETFGECAARELKEEAHLQSRNLQHVGVVNYKVLDKRHEDVVYVYTTAKAECEGTERETEEMSPITWFPTNAMPFDRMWPDARAWVPLALHTPPKRFSVDVFYEQERITSIKKQLFDDERSLIGACSA